MKKHFWGAGSVARRVSIIGGLSLTLTLLSILSLMTWIATDATRARTTLWVGDKTTAMADALDALDANSRVLVDKFFINFQSQYAAGFRLEPGSVLTHGAKPVAGDFSAVDRFSATTGGVATVFAREGEEFKRVTTSLKNESGQRAMGTLLARTHPAYPKLLAGQTYTGAATLFGKPYMTHYEPILGDDAKVIGILFIGFDTSTFHAALEKLVSDAKFYETGGVYVVDPKRSWADAVVVLHPTARGKKLSELAPNSEALYTALARTEELGAVATPGVLDPAHTDAWAMRRVSKNTGLWAISEVSDSQAMAKHWATLRPLWALLGGATLLLSWGLYIVMQRSVAKPLRELRRAVEAVAEGDLTQSFHSAGSSAADDEIGDVIRSVEAMRARLLKTMSAVRVSVDSISQASSEIAHGNADLSSRTEQAASSLQQTASSMEQLSGTVAQSADSARQADTLAGSAWSVASKGGDVVSQVVTTMEDINASSKKISDIIGVIDGIAFQTNILALNAAVEAARAGEQGRGFAVVASEVRSLAQRSANAAKEIKGLIGASVEKVASGTRLVADAGQTMNEILGSVQRVSQMIGEITAAATSQSAEIGQVSGAVGQLDQMTQQNAALVEQSAAAAESLKGQAQTLAAVVGGFKLAA